MVNAVNTDQTDYKQRRKYEANCNKRRKKCQDLIPATKQILNTLINLSCRINESMSPAQEIEFFFR